MAEHPRFTDEQIVRKIDAAPRLASLRSIGAALSDLVYAENSFTSQIAEIIRRDPSLTSRLLKLVNSVFFGLSQRVNNIEEAIFYLGLRQIRELALATPIIEDFDKLHGDFKRAEWHKLWRHSIGSGIVTREILNLAGLVFDDDTDYIVGLVHNVGKIVMATAFQPQFAELLEAKVSTPAEYSALEKELIGWDHAQIGAYYLTKHHLSAEIVEPVRFQNNPADAGEYARTAAAVQIADQVVRAAGIESIEPTETPPPGSWEQLEGWQILFGDRDAEDLRDISAAIAATSERLPQLLKGMI